MKYYRLKEINDWEGETWNFYIPVEGNQKEIEKLKSSLERCVFMRFKSSSGKFFFRLILDEHEIAVSRRYTTQLLLQKGIDEIIKYADKAEFLDFSSAEDIFGSL